MLQMEALCRCLRGLGTVSAVALQGARTPNWPAQPAIQPPMRHESNGHKLYWPYLLLVLNYVKYNLTIFKLHFVLVMMKCQFLFHFYFSQIFCDFGESFTVVDTNGEQPISNMISSVSKVTQILHKEYKKWAARTLICWVGFQGVYCMIKFLPSTCRSSTFKDCWKSNLSNVELINKQ